MGRGNHRGKSDDDGLGCAVMAGLALFVMPLVGLYLTATAKDDEQKNLGIVLTIIGFFVWIVAAMN